MTGQQVLANRSRIAARNSVAQSLENMRQEIYSLTRGLPSQGAYAPEFIYNQPYSVLERMADRIKEKGAL